MIVLSFCQHIHHVDVLYQLSYVAYTNACAHKNINAITYALMNFIGQLLWAITPGRHDLRDFSKM